MSVSSLATDIRSVRGDRQRAAEDTVAVEEPLEIQLCSGTRSGAAAKSIAVTMRTPGHDRELALGFLFTEGIVTDASDVVAVERCGAPDPDSGEQNAVRVELAADVTLDLDRLTRHFYTTSSCGVCGKASVDALRVAGCEAPSGSLSVSRAVLAALPAKLRRRQRVFELTGGLHAAAAFRADGELVVVREDVGRHNAVDKVIGALFMDGALPAAELGLVVSGRASFELTQKALVAGMPMLAAVSAPSSLAVRLAREFDMTLIGFLRDDRFNIYSGAERVDS